MFAFGARMNVCRCSVSVRSLRDILSSNRPKIAYRSMASCTRDFNNETDNDECLKVYNYFFNPTLLQDKVAVITGGGSGIGFRLTEVFMRHGCKTAIASRRLEKVTEAAEKLSAATGMPCLPLQADVRKPQQVEAALDEVLKTYGRVDILVNNAAGNFLSPVENLSYNAFKTVIEIDTIGTFNSSKAVYEKYFKEHGGNVINISATLHYKGRALQCHAGSAKAAVDAMTKHMAVEWGPRGVRVNSIAPGPIGGTVGMNKLGGKSPIASEMQRVIPLGRWGLKTEIADSALYLASDVSSYVTGHVMVVDGGEWLSSPNPPDLAAMLRPNM